MLWRSTVLSLALLTGHNITSYLLIGCSFLPRLSQLWMISEGAASYDGADKLRTCKVCVCNESLIVIRPETNVSSEQTITDNVSQRALASGWTWREGTHWEGCLICTSCAQTAVRGGKCTLWKHSVHLTEVRLCVCSCVSVKHCCC